MTKRQVQVHIVDDHEAMREALCFTLTDAGLTAEAYASAEEFLDAGGLKAEGCLILDLRMPGMDGSELHRRLRAAGSPMPVIILTGHGEVASAVRGIKAGAFDYLTKPVNREVLLRCVRSALALAEAHWKIGQEAAAVWALLEKLSHREKEVMEAVAAGQSSKQIARNLGISTRTIANHRAHFMQKMQATNTADLVRKLALAGHLGSGTPDAQA
jgi:two-component system, LuxR family, response regulator FixJ